jgi:hypothetical protein
MGMPFWIFVFLLYLARDELGLEGIVLCVVLWAAFVAGAISGRFPRGTFIVAQVLLDIFLLLKVLGRDVRIR